MAKTIIELSFQGFYGTLHETELDAQLESFLEENDRIYVSIEFDKLVDIYKLLKFNTDFYSYVYDKLKPCSGFIPNYPNDFKEWGTLTHGDNRNYLP